MSTLIFALKFCCTERNLINNFIVWKPSSCILNSKTTVPNITQNTNKIIAVFNSIFTFISIYSKDVFIGTSKKEMKGSCLGPVLLSPLKGNEMKTF